MRRPAAMVVVLAVSVAPHAAPAASAPTKAEFIRRGDALCTRTARELAPIARRAQAAQTLPEAKRWAAVTAIWSQQIRVQQRFNRRLRAIGVPPSDARARRIVRDLGRGVVLARRVRNQFAARDATEVARSLSAYLAFTVALNERVRAYGFRRCGR